jgi:hypothetical protein
MPFTTTDMSSDTHSLYRPKPGHWCSRGWKFCSSSRDLDSLPLEDAVGLANQHELSICIA